MEYNNFVTVVSTKASPTDSSSVMVCEKKENVMKLKNDDEGNSETSSNSKMDETLLSLAGLVQQEERSYAKYPALLVPTNVHSKKARDRNSNDHLETTVYYVDIECRTQMIEWCYQIVDFSKMNRTCVEITMSYVDRYVASSTCPYGQMALHDRSLYQLVCMTALYISVKLHDDITIMDPQIISTFSRGAHTIEEIEKMEKLLLFGLEWKLNPPTTVSYIGLFHQLIPESIVCPFIKQHVYPLAIQCTEIALMDYQLMSTKPSIIAYCAYMNALEYLVVSGMMIETNNNLSGQHQEDLVHHQNDSSKVLGYVGYILAQAIDVADSNDPYIVLVQHRLYESQYLHHSTTQIIQDNIHNHQPGAADTERSCIVVSPTHEKQEFAQAGQEAAVSGKKDEEEDPTFEISPRMVIDC